MTYFKKIMPVYPFKNTLPKIKDSAFVAPSADVIGDVTIGDDVGIWHQCVLRGDVNYIKIGNRTNIQDGSVIHVTSGGWGTDIGADVTVGHQVLLHACKVEDMAFIGMQACLMDEVVVESEAMVAAGSLVTPGKVIPRRQLWAGRPAKFFRELTDEDIAGFKKSADHYVSLMRNYK
jgi:carbonic anhydrase/acetyltransferase-like protein (isoleucine patch superfamily)